MAAFDLLGGSVKTFVSFYRAAAKAAELPLCFISREVKHIQQSTSGCPGLTLIFSFFSH